MQFNTTSNQISDTDQLKSQQSSQPASNTYQK